MSRPTKIFFQSNVYPACDALIAQGIRPTVGKVRDQLGITNGSNGTLQRLINEWYEHTRDKEVDKLNSGLSIESDIPVELIELARRLYDGVTKKAIENIDSFKGTLKDDRTWIRSQLREMAEVRERYEGQLESSESERLQQKKQLQEAYEEMRQLERMVAERQSEIRVLTEQITALSHTSNLEIRAAKKRAEELEGMAKVAESFCRMAEQQRDSEARLYRNAINDAIAILYRLINENPTLSAPELRIGDSVEIYTEVSTAIIKLERSLPSVTAAPPFIAK